MKRKLQRRKKTGACRTASNSAGIGNGTSQTRRRAIRGAPDHRRYGRERRSPAWLRVLTSHIPAGGPTAPPVNGFLRSLINNLQHGRSRLSPRLLAELSRYIPLTIDGSFNLLGYQLDEMGDIDFLLNGHRTRIIESYPFYRDREIDIPFELSETGFPQRNAFVSELVLRWQTSVRIRTINGPAWQRNGIFYVQIGVEDNLALSGLPPGAFVSVEPVSRDEQFRPRPNSVYLLQFGYGYFCCSCTVSRGKLILLQRSGRYAGPYEFLYPQEIRIWAEHEDLPFVSLFCSRLRAKCIRRASAPPSLSPGSSRR
jgi:hypothetical protein